LTEAHSTLSALARNVCRLPHARTVALSTARQAAQRLPLSRKNRQRIHNFFVNEVTPGQLAPCRVHAPGGGSLRLCLDLQDSVSTMWYFGGYTTYEPATTRLFCRLLRRCCSVFDVGSNIGYYALLAAALLRDRGHVHAFEPNPEVFPLFKASADLNPFPHLHLNQMAVSDVDGTLPLFLPIDNRISSSLVESHWEWRGRVDVPTVRLDSYSARHRIKCVDLLRLDVEGVEAKVLLGMGELLDRWMPDIICEVLNAPDDTLNRLMRGRPYRKFLITDDGLHEVDEIREHADFRDYYLSCNPVGL